MLGAMHKRSWQDRLGHGKGWMAHSYVLGTSHEQGYALPPSGPYQIMIDSTNPYQPGAGMKKLFISCSGADSPRPITLKVNDKGLWKAHEWSSLQLGMRAPVVHKSDDL